MIVYSNKLIAGIESALKSASQLTLQLQRKPEKKFGSKFVVQLDSAKYSAKFRSYSDKEDDSSRWALVDVRDAFATEAIWCGLRLSFIQWKVKEYGLDQVSFFGAVGENPLIPIIRAEWHHTAAIDSKSDHAQPHWHFLPAQFESQISTPESGAREFPAAATQPQFDCSRLHLAMAAEWHRALTHKSEFKSDKEVCDWIAGLVKYSLAQLTYGMSKSGYTEKPIPFA